jgi:hypothetical protein
MEKVIVESKKIKFLKELSKLCDLRTEKNLKRDLPHLESMLCTLTGDLMRGIQTLSELDPRKFGAKRKYEQLCEGTSLACKFFKSFTMGRPYQGHSVSRSDVEDALKAWTDELNRWATHAWSPFHGRQILLKEIVDPSIRGNFKAVDEFKIEIKSLEQ